ncbi:MAG TPA: hypothetical protein VMH81_24550 [Bryobacteraceae bacterium]|nr:hypothetical protein [Bryobacteraceae bacterium]
MPPQALAAVATLLSFAPHGNHIELRLDRGAAELVWITPSTFRFRRTLDGPLPAIQTREAAGIVVRVDDTPAVLRLRSTALDVFIRKQGVLVETRRLDGSPLMADLSEPRPSGSGVVWERQEPAGVRFYGLGPRTDPSFDVRGKSLETEAPFLFATSGYGEYHRAAGVYRFDFRSGDRYEIRAPAIDYYFHYGPTMKQVFEEHKDMPLGTQAWVASPDPAGSWDGLRATLLRLVHGAMSAMRAPSLALRPYDGMAPELVQRARQLGSLVDDVSPGPLGLSGFRKQLDSFYAIYAVEARDRGFPIWHPLPFQFPEDQECNLHPDEFMLGDEMLIAPILQPGGKRPVYLPRGVWTNLETNAVVPGRQTVEVETSGLPVFARNGTIVPLDSGGGLALHYFPTLPAEFFLLERDADDWTQVHAAPAGDIMRLEIEAKAPRDYHWVVHHVGRPLEVGFEGRKYPEALSAATMRDQTWFYDAGQKNLQIRVHVNAGEDRIINLSFQDAAR